MKINALLFSFALLISGMLITSCNKNITGNDNPNNVGNDSFSTGLNPGDDLNKIPSDFVFGNSNAPLPAKVDLSQRLPPMGDQGTYGTCVAWAAGYNVKSALNAIDKNLQTADLRTPARQTSPTDLFLAIPDNKKGSNCDGTSFEPAMDVMIRRGVANMEVAPYRNFGNCSQSNLNAAWAQNAGTNKVASYRKIENNVQTFKSYLSQDKPILIGMLTAQNFMAWRGEDVFVSQGAANTGQHGRHAMAIVGYDDSKGPRGAFKLVNSWGTNWGADGFIWVDYNLCVSNEFLMMAFVVNNAAGEIDPNTIDPTVAGDFNLMPYIEWDLPNESGSTLKSRTLRYNIYNLGNSTLKSSERWNMVYLYYNAFNINDYGVILYDSYTDQFGPKGQDGPLQSGIGISGNWWTNIDLPGRSGVAEALTNGNRDYFEWNYEMPSNLNGYYYMVAIVDPENKIKEVNESNNYQFLTNEYGFPVLIQNGIVIGLQGKDKESMSRNASSLATEAAVTPADMHRDLANAYSPAEISRALNHKIKSGELNVVKTASHKRK